MAEDAPPELTDAKRMKGCPMSVEDVQRTFAHMRHNDPFKNRAPTDEERHFRAMCGASFLVATIGWNMMLELNLLPDKAEIKHYLWALAFCKVYPTDKTAAQLTGADVKTFRKWVQLMLDSIVDLEAHVIVWENRKEGDIGNDSLTGTDCTDFRIPGCGRRFASHKCSKRLALQCEVCVCIITGWLVWINGPCEAGNWPDISIFRNALMSHFDEGERTQSDKGHYGECPGHCQCPGHITSHPDMVELDGIVRSRTETINNRFKQWGVLKQCFHSLDFSKHSQAFRCVAIHTQLSIQNGEPLFQLECIDPHLNDLVYFEHNGVEECHHQGDEEEGREAEKRGRDD